MSDQYLSFSGGHTLALAEASGMAPSVHVFDEDSILAVNAALATGRPLLVRGEPGTGKSQLARAAGQALGRAFIAHAVDARTETRDLLWSVDTVARLAEAQVMGALGATSDEDVRRRIDVREFLHPGPLWWAFNWASALRQAERARVQAPPTPAGWTPERGVVVLVDEVDKADSAVPNGLLDALGHGRFDVPGLETVTLQAGRAPLIIFTTNEERALPDAFLRRCLVLHLALSDHEPEVLRQELVGRGRAHFSRCSEKVLVACAEVLALDRRDYREQELAPPGLAEYLDLVRAVIHQCDEEADQLALLAKISKFALRKHPPEPGGR